MNKVEVEIKNKVYWFKIVEFLQQNWAVIEKNKNNFIVYFFGDTSGVFDSIEYENIETAEKELKYNGFKKYDDDVEAQKFIHKPEPIFYESQHPNGKIYSSGRFWKKLYINNGNPNVV
jgi:hypothetical protein